MPDEKPRLVCGLVMPISTIDGLSEAHWADVLAILTGAIDAAGFDANLVSNADDVGIIQKRIIQNLYDNPVVVCDVSGKNPNVMFELGLRLAFDKPTIIVKDDKTSYSFDTSPIEHLQYPRDLRFAAVVEFKQKLAEKIKATHEKASTDPSYTTFLKNFGEFTVAKLDKKEVSGQEYLLEEMRTIRLALQRLDRPSMNLRKLGLIRGQPDVFAEAPTLQIVVQARTDEDANDFLNNLAEIVPIERFEVKRDGDQLKVMFNAVLNQGRQAEIKALVDNFVARTRKEQSSR